MEAHRLEAVAGFTCVLAVRLLQLKTVATTHPDLPAERVVPKLWLKMLGALRKRKLITFRDFFRHLAGLGGFLMRERDGDYGWMGAVANWWSAPGRPALSPRPALS